MPIAEQQLIREAAYLVDYFQMSHDRIARYLCCRYRLDIDSATVSFWLAQG